MSHKEQPLIPSHPKRILLPRFDTLGDIVLLEGFLESLQELYPQAKRALLVRKGYDTLSPLFHKTIEWIKHRYRSPAYSSRFLGVRETHPCAGR